MSVVGFDIGNENCVIAAAKYRGIDVLLNDESNRETPAVVSFGDKQRFLGLAGAASATMNPKSTISQVKRLIGINYRDTKFQEELNFFPFEISEGPDGGVLIHLQYMGTKQSFTPVQILGMLFSHLKSIAEKNLESPVSDCVIGIPSYFTNIQRRAYLFAAAIAGLNPLRLLHDCTATALGYGIYRTDLSGNSRIYVVFIDIGHYDTQVCVASFEGGHMTIISHAFDSYLGGRDFDEVLFRYFARQFKEQYDIDVYSNIRACIRLRAACEKLKKVLSANAEAALNIECLMDERDVKGFIKREEFEKLSSDLLKRITVPCRKALDDAKLSLDKLHSVELVGSGSRIPAISRMLASLFRREPSRTLNASECVARGCALQCAMLSPTLRVREYEVQDPLPFSIGCAAYGGRSLSRVILFPKRQLIPCFKTIDFKRTDVFHLEIFYADPSELPPGVSPNISYFTIGPFPVSHTGLAKIKVRFLLNLHGIVTVELASLLEDQLDDLDARKNAHSNLDNMGSESAYGTSNSEANGANDGSFAHAESLPMPAADGIRKHRLSRRLNIPVSETIYGGMSINELPVAQEKETQMALQDRIMEHTKERKNALESYIYEMRSKLFDTYRSFATDSEREGISRNLQQTEEWLYEDGIDESETVYTGKLEDLKKLVDPIENRYKDEEAREQATKDLLNCISDHEKVAKSLPSKDGDAVIDECNKAKLWLTEKLQEQTKLPKNTDPVLWSSEIKRRMEALDVTCKHILSFGGSPMRSEDTKGPEQPNIPDDMQTD